MSNRRIASASIRGAGTRVRKACQSGSFPSALHNSRTRSTMSLSRRNACSFSDIEGERSAIAHAE